MATTQTDRQSGASSITGQTNRASGVIGIPGWKTPVVAATTANITLSAEQTIDGVSVTSGDRVLVKDQTDQTENGIYECATGTWNRTADFDGAYDVVTGTTVYITGGTTSANTFWSVTTTGTITIGTSLITWEQNPDLSVATDYTRTFLAAANAAAARAVLGSSATGDSLFTAADAAAARTVIAAAAAADVLNYLLLAGGTMTGDIACADNLITRPEIKDYAETLSTNATSGAAATIDLENGNVHNITLTANCTLTFSNPPATGRVGSFTLILRQDGTGSRTVTWPASVDWASATAPTLSTAASSVDVLTFFTIDGGTIWLGQLSGKGYA